MKKTVICVIVLALALLFSGCEKTITLHCDGCGKEYGTVEHGKICPHCGSENTWLLRGNEVEIKEIEVPNS